MELERTWSADYFLWGGEEREESQGCAVNCRRSHTQAAAINIKCLDTHTYNIHKYIYTTIYIYYLCNWQRQLWQKRNTLGTLYAAAVDTLIHTHVHIHFMLTYVFTAIYAYLTLEVP